MGKIDHLKIPGHIAIIMDGNGRWARKRHLPKIAGHKAGIKTIEKVMQASKELGIKILTLYAFSTENWKRPKKEVDALMWLLENYLDLETERLHSEGVRLSAIGRTSGLPQPIQAKLKAAEKKTINNKKLFLNLAINYGGRSEITDAAKKIAEDVKHRRIAIDSITEGKFPGYLYTKGMPDPDLLIRTSGEMRISNFLLWQIAYSEIYITNKFWPDFNKKDLEKAILDYQTRERRYGG